MGIYWTCIIVLLNIGRCPVQPVWFRWWPVRHTWDCYILCSCCHTDFKITNVWEFGSFQLYHQTRMSVLEEDITLWPKLLLELLHWESPSNEKNNRSIKEEMCFNEWGNQELTVEMNYYMCLHQYRHDISVFQCRVYPVFISGESDNNKIPSPEPDWLCYKININIIHLRDKWKQKLCQKWCWSEIRCKYS